MPGSILNTFPQKSIPSVTSVIANSIFHLLRPKQWNLNSLLHTTCNPLSKDYWPSKYIQNPTTFYHPTITTLTQDITNFHLGFGKSPDLVSMPDP